MKARKALLCIVGVFLFAMNPLRDLWFYESIATHEGFGTTHDTFIIGVAGQLVVTLLLVPVAIGLIAYGIGAASVVRLVPRFDRFTWPWGIFATLLAILMVLIECDYLIYTLRYPHHYKTALISLTYVAFIYVWWTYSIAHQKPVGPAAASA